MCQGRLTPSQGNKIGEDAGMGRRSVNGASLIVAELSLWAISNTTKDARKSFAHTLSLMTVILPGKPG